MKKIKEIYQRYKDVFHIVMACISVLGIGKELTDISHTHDLFVRRAARNFHRHSDSLDKRRRRFARKRAMRRALAAGRKSGDEDLEAEMWAEELKPQLELVQKNKKRLPFYTVVVDRWESRNYKIVKGL